ncbi:MAG: hypothetical protein R3F62_02830 [Planctomycetota bacterium]
MARERSSTAPSRAQLQGAGLLGVELLARAPSPAQVAWVRGLFSDPPASGRVVSESPQAAGELARALGWSGLEVVGSVGAPEQLATPPGLRIVLCEGRRDAIKRWALRKAAGPVLIACGDPPTSGPLRLELRQPGELGLLTPWLAALAPEEVELTPCPALASSNQLAALRELEVLEANLGRVALSLRARGFAVTVASTARARPARLVLRVRPERGLRGWFQDDDAGRLRSGASPILRVPPSQARAHM